MQNKAGVTTGKCIVLQRYLQEGVAVGDRRHRALPDDEATTGPNISSGAKAFLRQPARSTTQENHVMAAPPQAFQPWLAKIPLNPQQG